MIADQPAISSGILLSQITACLSDKPPDYTGKLPDSGARKAAVLMLFAEEQDQLSILLTQRAHHLRIHAGQVSLPGGKPEQADNDGFATALREAEEEIGLSASLVRRLGYSLPVLTSTNYLVDVAVGLSVVPTSRLTSALSVCEDEVAAAWCSPAAHLLSVENYLPQRRQAADGSWRDFFVIEGTDPPVWGATANILHCLAMAIR